MAGSDAFDEATAVGITMGPVEDASVMKQPTKRAYSSAVRSAAAADTRERILAASIEVLGGAPSISEFTLDAVASASGVARFTIYNQFGSRRSLLEAAFDRLCEHARLPDPSNADVDLPDLIAGYCRLWGDPAAGRIQEVSAADPELHAAMCRRHDSRRVALEMLVRRLAHNAGIKARSEAVDVLFGLTGPHFYHSVAAARSPKGAAKLVESVAQAALSRLVSVA